MELNSAQIAQFDDQRYLLLRGAPVVHAGLRSGEIYRLQWRDIDWETGELTVESRRGEHTKN